MSGDDGSVSSECDEAGATQAPAGLGSATQMPNIVPLYHLVSGSESYPGIAELCAKPEAGVRLGRLGDAPIGVNHANVDTISRHHVTLSRSDNNEFVVHHASPAPAARTFVYDAGNGEAWHRVSAGLPQPLPVGGLIELTNSASVFRFWS